MNPEGILSDRDPNNYPSTCNENKPSKIFFQLLHTDLPTRWCFKVRYKITSFIHNLILEQQILAEYEAAQGFDEAAMESTLQAEDPEFVTCPVCQKWASFCNIAGLHLFFSDFVLNYKYRREYVKVECPLIIWYLILLSSPQKTANFFQILWMNYFNWILCYVTCYF